MSARSSCDGVLALSGSGVSRENSLSSGAVSCVFAEVLLLRTSAPSTVEGSLLLAACIPFPSPLTTSGLPSQVLTVGIPSWLQAGLLSFNLSPDHTPCQVPLVPRMHSHLPWLQGRCRGAVSTKAWKLLSSLGRNHGLVLGFPSPQGHRSSSARVKVLSAGYSEEEMENAMELRQLPP